MLWTTYWNIRIIPQSPNEAGAELHENMRSSSIGICHYGDSTKSFTVSYSKSVGFGTTQRAEKIMESFREEIKAEEMHNQEITDSDGSWFTHHSNKLHEEISYRGGVGDELHTQS